MAYYYDTPGMAYNYNKDGIINAFTQTIFLKTIVS